MRVIYVYKRIPHHATHSGYDQLPKYVPSKGLNLSVGNIIAKAIEVLPEKHVKPWFMPQAGGWYKKEFLAQEIQIVLGIPFHIPFNKTIYHYLYGEDSFRWGGFIPYKFNSKIVATFHQPPSVFNEVIKDKTFITKADAIVVCGTNQMECFEEITGRNNVYFVPHGIDTNFFSPSETQKRNAQFNTVSVGWWLRDNDMIKRIIMQSNKLSLGIKFNIITFPNYFDHYKVLENVNLLTGLSDEDLRNKYREADVLLLPLKDSTANNAILEAMSCGKPVLTTDVGGVRDYVTDKCGIIGEPDKDEVLIEGLRYLMKDFSAKEQIGVEARKRALEFDWRRVAVAMMNVYKQII